MRAGSLGWVEKDQKETGFFRRRRRGASRSLESLGQDTWAMILSKHLIDRQKFVFFGVWKGYNKNIHL
jgi:hypothetical protein